MTPGLQVILAAADADSQGDPPLSQEQADLVAAILHDHPAARAA